MIELIHVNLNLRLSVSVFITAGPSTKLFTWGGGRYGRTCATRDDEPMGPLRNPVL
jgi:hypothetical protein